MMEKKGLKLLEAAKFIGMGLLVGIVLSAVFVLSSGWNKAQEGDVTHITEIDPGEGESRELEVTIEYIDKKLEHIAELSTAEMIYTSLYTVTEGKIPFLTQKGFSMVYTAQVRAGDRCFQNGNPGDRKAGDRHPAPGGDPNAEGRPGEHPVL